MEFSYFGSFCYVILLGQYSCLKKHTFHSRLWPFVLRSSSSSPQLHLALNTLSPLPLSSQRGTWERLQSEDFPFHLWLVSPTFYKQLLCWFPFTQKLQTQTVSTEKLQKILLYKKAAPKMLVKLTPGFSSIASVHPRPWDIRGYACVRITSSLSLTSSESFPMHYTRCFWLRVKDLDKLDKSWLNLVIAVWF